MKMMMLCRISHIFKIKKLCHLVAPMVITSVVEALSLADDHPSRRGVPLPQIKPPGLEPDPSGPSRASLSHCIPAGALLPREFLNGLREIDSVAVHPINRLSPLSDPCGAPGFDTGDKTRGEDYEWQSTEEAEAEQKGGGVPL